MRFEDAHAIALTLNIKNPNATGQWNAWCTSGRRPDGMPPHPNIEYCDAGWQSWAHWLGYAGSCTNPRSLDEALSFARSLKLKTVKEWKNWLKHSPDERPDDIPPRPDAMYGGGKGGNGWQGWSYWLGTDLRTKQEKNEQKQAKEAEMRVKSPIKWQEQEEKKEKKAAESEKKAATAAAKKAEKAEKKAAESEKKAATAAAKKKQEKQATAAAAAKKKQEKQATAAAAAKKKQEKQATAAAAAKKKQEKREAAAGGTKKRKKPKITEAELDGDTVRRTAEDDYAKEPKAEVRAHSDQQRSLAPIEAQAIHGIIHEFLAPLLDYNPAAASASASTSASTSAAAAADAAAAAADADAAADSIARVFLDQKRALRPGFKSWLSSKLKLPTTKLKTYLQKFSKCKQYQEYPDRLSTRSAKKVVQKSESRHLLIEIAIASYVQPATTMWTHFCDPTDQRAKYMQSANGAKVHHPSSKIQTATPLEAASLSCHVLGRSPAGVSAGYSIISSIETSTSRFEVQKIDPVQLPGLEIVKLSNELAAAGKMGLKTVQETVTEHGKKAVSWRESQKFAEAMEVYKTALDKCKQNGLAEAAEPDKPSIEDFARKGHLKLSTIVNSAIVGNTRFTQSLHSINTAEHQAYNFAAELLKTADTLPDDTKPYVTYSNDHFYKQNGGAHQDGFGHGRRADSGTLIRLVGKPEGGGWIEFRPATGSKLLKRSLLVWIAEDEVLLMTPTIACEGFVNRWPLAPQRGSISIEHRRVGLGQTKAELDAAFDCKGAGGGGAAAAANAPPPMTVTFSAATPHAGCSRQIDFAPPRSMVMAAKDGHRGAFFQTVCEMLAGVAAESGGAEKQKSKRDSGAAFAEGVDVPSKRAHKEQTADTSPAGTAVAD